MPWVVDVPDNVNTMHHNKTATDGPGDGDISIT